MFRVHQTKGDSYVVNRSHILSLVKTGTNLFKRGKSVLSKKGTIVDISISDYLDKSAGFKWVHKGYKVGVNFSLNEENTLPVDPYFLGLWLGDGTSEDQSITTADFEVASYLGSLAKRMGLRLSITPDEGNKSSRHSIVGERGKGNELLNQLRKIGVINNKHIPHPFITSSRNERLKLLAGLIDSDGYVNHGGYVFVNKNERLANNVLFLARSLGFASYIKSFRGRCQTGAIGTYFKVGISGDCSIVPVLISRKKVLPRKQIKNTLVTGIHLESLGEGDYYGFTLDGNRRFLLGDFTVTHNTTLAMTITQNMAETGVQTLWFTLEVTPRQFIKKIMGNSPDLKKLPLFYLPAKNEENTIDWIEKRIIEAQVKHNVKVVFIDHIHQIFSLDRMKYGNVSLELGDMVAKVKDMALRYNLVIVLIAHTKDPADGSMTREPSKESIRDSGLISRLADSIIAIWRVPSDKTVREELKTFSRRPIREGDVWSKVRVLKNRRNGSLGTLVMRHNNHRLEELMLDEVEPLAPDDDFDGFGK